MRESLLTGHELLLLNDELRDTNPIVGIDLSPGMVAIANQLILSHTQQAASCQPALHPDVPSQNASKQEQQVMSLQQIQHQQLHDGHQSPGTFSHQRSRMRAMVGDAAVLPKECLPAVAVLSVFGLQQMTAEADVVSLSSCVKGEICILEVY